MNTLRNALTASLVLLTATILGPLISTRAQDPQNSANPPQLAQEEAADYYSKWLSEDVVYIITGEETAVFGNLTTPEEKEQFIEQFWFRRDPDPTTAENEFKEEHYRRIAYSNEMFASGIKGWQTDRGKIYIIHGPPDEIQSRPAGGPYHRPTREGGGTTQVFPFEVWRYRHLPGMGQNIELEFVDRTQSGEYRLSMTPDEKDVLLHVPGAGLTLAEEFGFAKKEDRLIFSPWKRFEYRGPFTYFEDPFERYENYVNIRKPADIRYTDLKSLVEVNITYDALPLQVRFDYLQLNEAQTLVPVTVEIANRELSFVPEEGVHSAKVAVYGVVTSITNRLTEEFDDDLMTAFSPEQVGNGLLGRSLYQRVITLDAKLRYKLTLVVKDTRSGKIGTLTQAIVPPQNAAKKLAASSLILADSMRQLDEIPTEPEMFVLGDFFVRPNLSKKFVSDHPLNTYYQLYNVGFDQGTLQPSLSMQYTIRGDNGSILEFPDLEGKSVQYSSGRRVVVAAGFPLDSLSPGRYSLDIQIVDKIAGSDLLLHDRFEVVGPTAASEGSGGG